MVQLKILSGKKAGAVWSARRFPVRLGRAATADLQSDDDGVWDQHLQLDFRRAEGYVVSTQANALARVNGESVTQTLLRNGDIIEIGSLRLQFWLGDTGQHSVQLRETLIWAGVAAILLAQVGLVYWLSR